MRIFQGIVVALLLAPSITFSADSFRVATYNLENYLDAPTESRPNPKSAESRAKIRETILHMKPDILAVQEIGKRSALTELQQSLKSAGLDLPHWEHVGGFDTNIFVAVLSKFPITARRSHTNQNFLLGGRRYQVSRGFAEVDIQVNARYTLTVMTAHLKSKRSVGFADEAEMRLEEAKLLRRIVDARLAANPNLNLVLLGDFNDTRNSQPVRTILGRGRARLIDTRPGECGDSIAPGTDFARSVTWTHFFGQEDTYSRIDYILLSPALANEWVRSESCVPRIPGWGIASDHRPVVATFQSTNR